MSVLSDKWIKKMVKSHKIISPFIRNKQEKEKYHTVYPHTDTMQEFLMILKYSQM